MKCQKDLRIRKYVKSQEKQASVLTKKKFHYSRNMAKVLNKRSMQIYADMREMHRRKSKRRLKWHFQMEDCRR